MKSLFFLIVISLFTITVDNSLELPVFPKIEYSKVKIGQKKLNAAICVDNCSTKSGGCSAKCCNPGCTCTCGPGGCSCDTGTGGAQSSIQFIINERTIKNLERSAKYFKSLKSKEGDDIYIAMVDVANAIIENDQNKYHINVNKVNTLAFNLTNNQINKYNTFADKNELNRI